MASNVELTQRAATKIQRLFHEKDLNANAHLRIAVQGGGCSGLSYKISIDDEPDGHDRTFESHGVKVCVDKKSFLYTTGLQLDWNPDDFHGGFEFHNPKAKTTCGCGTSFSV